MPTASRLRSTHRTPSESWSPTLVHCWPVGGACDIQFSCRKSSSALYSVTLYRTSGAPKPVKSATWFLQKNAGKNIIHQSQTRHRWVHYHDSRGTILPLSQTLHCSNFIAILILASIFQEIGPGNLKEKSRDKPLGRLPLWRMIVKIQINEYQSLIVQNQKKAASSLENVQHEEFREDIVLRTGQRAWSSWGLSCIIHMSDMRSL